MHDKTKIKVLFAHNGPLYRVEDQYYTRTLGNKLVQRYLSLGKSVTYCMQVNVKKNININKYEKLNKKDLQISELPKVMTLKSRLYNQSVLKKTIRDNVEKHDIIIVRVPSYVGNIALRYAKKIDKPYIVEFVACPWDAMWYYNWKGKIMAPYAYLKNRRAIADSKHVIYVTNQFLQDRYPTKGKSYSISNVEIEEVSEDVLKIRLKKIEDMEPGGIITLGTAANIDVPYKGQADVIQALYLLKKEGITNFRYRIVGAGNPGRLQNLINKLEMKDFVAIEGAVRHSEILSFYDELDIYIQPSKQEGLPRSVIEAMSRGCPVVGARTGGIPELIDQEFIFGKGKIRELKKCLTDIVEYKMLIRESIKNFNEAGKYYKPIIDHKRKAIYDKFLSSYFTV